MLVRVSDSELGSSEAHVQVDGGARTVSGSVSSGNFCGYINEVDRRSYYTLYFVAIFDQPFASFGTWENDALKPGVPAATGGTTYGTNGYPPVGKGSGAYVSFDTASQQTVRVRVGISYVSEENARKNLAAENPTSNTFETVRLRAREAWNKELNRIEITAQNEQQYRTFYTALYHSLHHPNIFSDVTGEYWGFDQKIHTVAGPQRSQYANFSGWDVYRSQVQLVTLLDPARANDIAQSLFNQAQQNNGEWDRWTHNSGATHVMEGDAAAPAIAGIYAFGGTNFDAKGALASLLNAARRPTPNDLSDKGCRVECPGQRPSLDKWLTIHYIPTVSNAWGGAGETLEDATADFSLSQLALKLGDSRTHDEFLDRAQYWENIFNEGYIRNRNADGTWPEFDPASSNGFAEGSSAQYTWMVPFNPRGLFDKMGGNAKANERLDSFFKNPDGSWALTGLGGLHSEVNNEPSIGAPWLYLYSGKPYKTQETVRAAVNILWTDRPHGIPGNDDLGEMSSWYVFSAMGFYPGIPGRAELLLASPLFTKVIVRRANGKTITIRAPQARTEVPYVQSLRVNGQVSTKPWLPESFVATGGELDFVLSTTPNTTWGSNPADAPPSFSQH
jgi:predicted alpha-1,2-mannosidase